MNCILVTFKLIFNRNVQMLGGKGEDQDLVPDPDPKLIISDPDS